MKDWVTDELVRAIRSRCRCGGNCTCCPGGGDAPERRRDVRPPAARLRRTPALRLVPNCGSLLKARPEQTGRSDIDPAVRLTRELFDLVRLGRKHPNWEAHVEAVLDGDE